MDIISGFFALAFTLPGGLMFALGGVVAWVGRKYLVKTKPDEVAMIDAFGTKYGQRGEKAIKDLFAEFK